jgi:cytochrome c biogenesis protein CcmG, thiol:disulfide interchange protein DsbE
VSARQKQWLRYVLWFAAAAGVALLLSRRSSGPDVGVPAPEVDLPVIASAGQRLKLGGALDAPVVIEAFTSWCSVCERSAPRFTAAAQARRKRDVRFVGVSLDESVEIAQRVKESWGLPYEVAFDDGSFSRGFKIKLLPTLIVIDETGHVRHVSTGGLDRDELEEQLDALGAGVRD